MNRPRIGFDGYKEEWQKKRLGDIAELIGGGTPNTKKRPGIPFSGTGPN